MGNKENREMRNPGPDKPDSILLRNEFWVLGVVGAAAAGISHELIVAGVTVGLFSMGGAFLDFYVQKENNIEERRENE